MNPSASDTQTDAHLGYLLTAYVFDSLSAAGRKEVQDHLSTCAECRAQLSVLLKTLGAAEEAFDSGAKEYTFEKRRRQRVLDAASNARPSLFRRLDFTQGNWIARIAAILMVLVVGGILLPTLGSNRISDVAYEASQKSAPAYKTESVNLYDNSGRPVTPASSSALGSIETRETLKNEESDVGGGGAVDPNSPSNRYARKDSKPAPEKAGEGTFARRRSPQKPQVGESLNEKKAKSPSDNRGLNGIPAPTEFDDSKAAADAPSRAGGKDRLSQTAKNADEFGPGAAPAAPKPDPLRPLTDGDKDVAKQPAPAVRFKKTLEQEKVLKEELASRVEETKPKTNSIVYDTFAFQESGIASGDDATKLRPAPAEPAFLGFEQSVLQGISKQKAADGKADAPRRSEPSVVPAEVLDKAELGDHFEIIPEDKSVEFGRFSGRTDLAIAAKDSESRDQRDLIEQERAANISGDNAAQVAEMNKLEGVKNEFSAKGQVLAPRQQVQQQLKRANATNDGLELENLPDAAGTELEDMFGVGGAGWGGGRGTENQSKDKSNTGGFGSIDSTGKVSRIDPARAENLLRGYRHLHAENPRLTWANFLRRPAPVPPPLLTDEGLDEDAYIEKYGTRPFVDCSRDHLSTFGLDVDTASYTLTRSRLRQNELPDPEAVRVEEFLNYFKQPYTVIGDDAFGVFAEGAPSPFSTTQSNRATQILKVGIKSREPRPDERKPAMLTFVVDTSGSMTRGDRLELVRFALKDLVEQLNAEDAVCIVGFNDQAELLLPRTQARQKQRILDAIDAMTVRGATNVEAGLTMGYRLADEAYSPDAVNRVILCSDGVANVGAKGPDEVLKLVKVFAGRGIDLCAVGFGMGQYNDQMMTRLANTGNGSCYFVDSRAEAQKVFREQLPPNLNVLARDAKAQVDFNPDVVERYRLLGYEKRKIADTDFRNDKIDAGEVAHSTLITVMYEIQRKPSAPGPLGKVFLRWKDAGHRHLPVIERNYPLSEGVLAGSARNASPELRFLACVARFAELLRGSKWVQDSSYAAVLEQLAQLPPAFQARADFNEVKNLIQRAQALTIQKWSAGNVRGQ